VIAFSGSTGGGILHTQTRTHAHTRTQGVVQTTICLKIDIGSSVWQAAKKRQKFASENTPDAPRSNVGVYDLPCNAGWFVPSPRSTHLFCCIGIPRAHPDCLLKYLESGGWGIRECNGWAPEFFGYRSRSLDNGKSIFQRFSSGFPLIILGFQGILRSFRCTCMLRALNAPKAFC
jgi:hypothetical protein